MDPEVLRQLEMMRQYLMTGEGYDPFGSSQLPMSPGYGNVIAPNLDKEGNPKPMDVAGQAKAMNALQDWASIGSDPAVLGGMYGQMPGQGLTTYQPLEGQMMLQNALSRQDTIDSFIADEIANNNGSANSAISKINAILALGENDPAYQALYPMLPKKTITDFGQTQVVVDEGAISDTANMLYSAVLKDNPAGAVVDPNTGLLSTATTEEDPLAQWYRETGTPLPSETYSPDMLATPGQLQGEQRARERFRGTDPNGMPPMGAAQAASLGVPAPQYGGGSSQMFNEANAAAMRYLADNTSGLPTYNNLVATPGKMVSDSQPQGPGQQARSGMVDPNASAMERFVTGMGPEPANFIEDKALPAVGGALAAGPEIAAKALAAPGYIGNAIGNLFRKKDDQQSFSVDPALGALGDVAGGLYDAMDTGRSLTASQRAQAAGPQVGGWLQQALSQGAEPAATGGTRKKGKPDVIKRADARASKIPAAVQKKRKQAADLDWANRGTLQQNRIDQQVRDLAMREIAAAGHTPYNDTMMQRRMMAQMAGFGY